MLAKKVVDILLGAVPRAAEWTRMQGEAYGPYNVNPEYNIRRVLYCVTPTRAVETFYRERGEWDLLVAHHPMKVGPGIPQVILHTALDCCDGGLNDQWRDGLGLRYAEHFDGTLGWYGQIKPTSFKGLCAQVEAFMERPIVGARYSTLDTIRSVVICTGAGGMVWREAAATGADCYILGEASMPPEHMGFPAVIETGHTNSEWVGARLIQKLLAPHGVAVDVAPAYCDRFGGEAFTRNADYGIIR